MKDLGKPDFLPGSAHPAFASLRILVVDDHAVNRRLCGLMLRDLGCEADYAEDGHQAVEMLVGKKYDLVLMDCMLPAMDGLTATRFIRANEERVGSGHRAHIVAFTVNAAPGESNRCLRAGMDDFLAKPVTASQLVKVIWEATRTRSAAARPPAAAAPEKGLALDVGRISQLCDEIDEGVVVEVVSMFLDALAQQCEECRHGLEKAMFPELTRNAHSIKGAASTLGASALEQSAAALENAAALADRGRATQELDRMLAATEPTRIAMKSWLSTAT
ncbi:MAG: hypothetical protein JWL90_3064 [Chthoniobacteraceae bacterium]|nr:hypothetical protein [Chthoniobacteraceae bacterium]